MKYKILFLVVIIVWVFVGYYFLYYDPEPKLLIMVDTKMTKRQADRMRKLRATCAKRSRFLYGLNELMVRQRHKDTHFYLSETKKVIYCGVPKTGSSNWKRVLLILNGEKENVTQMANAQIHTRPLKKLFKQLGEGRIKYMIKHFYKFVFVRHPFVRLVSAYRNKLSDNNPYFEKMYGSRILRAYRHNLTEREYKLGKGVTFQEFVQWLIDKQIFNQHWAPMTSLCHPCIIPFNFVGKMESFDDDVKYMMGVLGTGFKFPTNQRRSYNVSSTRLMEEYFSTLSKTTISRLYKSYRYDFETFDYEVPKKFRPAGFDIPSSIIR